jgi:hypothetical protein
MAVDRASFLRDIQHGAYRLGEYVRLRALSPVLTDIADERRTKAGLFFRMSAGEHFFLEFSDIISS